MQNEIFESVAKSMDHAGTSMHHPRRAKDNHELIMVIIWISLNNLWVPMYNARISWILRGYPWTIHACPEISMDVPDSSCHGEIIYSVRGGHKNSASLVHFLTVNCLVPPHSTLSRENILIIRSTRMLGMFSFLGHFYSKDYWKNSWKAPKYYSASPWINNFLISLWENPTTSHFHDFGIFGRVADSQNRYYSSLETPRHSK